MKTGRQLATRKGAKAALPAFPVFEHAQHRTLHDHAYGQIRNALMTGRFMPGQKMTIRGLAAALNISPTPVREAVRRLAAEGAIEMQPNRWMKVPLLPRDALEEMRDIRTSLEGLATERAVSRITQAEIEELKKTDAAIRALRGTGDVPGMILLIHKFHHTIYAAARMPTLKQLIESQWLRSGPYVNLLFTGYTGEERGQLRAVTLKAIERRDALTARRSMEADVGNAVEYLIDLTSKAASPKPARVHRRGSRSRPS